MKVKVLREAGVEEALLGLSLSYNSEPSIRVANNLAHKQGGHNKFLESVQVWLDVTAPLYFWKQLDTYRVGTSKQSESTMHTLMRKELTQDNFEGGIHEGFLESLNYWIEVDAFDTVNKHLPSSFLQRRIISTNYKVLQSIYNQRRGHKLKEWNYFREELIEQLEKPEWISKGLNKEAQ